MSKLTLPKIDLKFKKEIFLFQHNADLSELLTLGLLFCGQAGSDRVLAEVCDLENSATLDKLFESLVISR